MQRFDDVVIGTGQSGPPLAVRLAKAGRKVAIIERKRFGGTCVNNGCIPSKTLIASARAAHVARRGAELGVMIDGEIKVDMKRVKARKDAVVAASTQGVETWLRDAPGLTVIEAHARFESPHRVRAGEEVLEAERFFIDVGGRASSPPIPGLDAVPFLDNSSIMEVDFLPAHLVVLGGSYIGLEFAQMYRRFGSRVTVLERGPFLVGREDEDVSRTIREFLEAEGVEFKTSSEIARVERDGDAIIVHGSTKDAPSTPWQVRGSHLLVAMGRVPNTSDLGLDLAGITTDARGYITVDDGLRTNVEHVWALGDCNGRGAFTHTSYNDFEILAHNLLDGESRKVSDRIPAYALYVDPPLGRVGMNEKEVRASKRKALIGKRMMTRVGRAFERGETAGFMKILVDAETKQILGASLLGIECDEVVHCLLDVMYAKAPYTVIERAMHIHPTVSELVPTILEELVPLE